MKNFRSIILIFCFFPVFAFSQVSVKAKIDSSTLFIGQQTDIQLEIIQPKNSKTVFPVIKDTLLAGLEVLKVSKRDTLFVDNKEKITSTITVTAFDSAVYQIPPFVFIHGKDTLRTNSLSLKIMPVQVDTTKQNLYDIKPIYELPADYTQMIVIIVLIILLVIAVIFLFFYLKKRKKQTLQVTAIEEEPIVEVNPKEEALRALVQIQKDKIWQQGKVKEYYTDITQVVRLYIERQLGIIALEMTTDEILFDVRRKINADVFELLKELLSTADLVKFAKFVPNENDYEQALKWAFEFVTSTSSVTGE
jgi:hypothetical protein